MDKHDECYDALKSMHYNGEHEEALKLLQGINIDRDIASEDRWKYFELLGICYLNTGNIAQAADYLKKAIYAPGNMSVGIQRRIYSQYLLVLHYLPNLSDKKLYQEHMVYNQLFAGAKQYTHNRKIKKSDTEKIRIGYFVPSGPGHIIYRFIRPLLLKFDSERYEITCYSQGEMGNPYGMEHLLDGTIRQVNLYDMAPPQAAQRIYDDEIDILVDTDGHTNGGWGLQVAGYKPAPIQVEGIGYFNTTGLKTMDYFLGDIYCDPASANKLFSETILRMPHSHFCYYPVAYLKNYQIRHRSQTNVVYGCFNNFYKITDEMLHVWLQLMERVPGAKLLLKNVKKDAYFVENMYERARRIGFTDKNFEARPRTENFADDYMEIDIALDTFPYPGGGTTCDALYLGIPVISMYGKRHGSRFGYSILKNLGLDELVASNKDEYISKAALLAQDRELLSLLHQNLRKMMERSPIMDEDLYIYQIEKFYEHIYHTWQNKA